MKGVLAGTLHFFVKITRKSPKNCRKINKTLFLFPIKSVKHAGFSKKTVFQSSEIQLFF